MLKLKRLKEILAAFKIDISKVGIHIDADLTDVDKDGNEAIFYIVYDGKTIYTHTYDLWR